MSHRSWLREHSLSAVIGSALLVWLVVYWRSDSVTHLGACYGNALADWLGSFVTVTATQFWFERGSARVAIHLCLEFANLSPNPVGPARW